MNVIDNLAGSLIAFFNDVFVVPVRQKKRKFDTFVYKNHALVTFLERNNPTFPNLPEKQKVELHMHFAAGLVAIVTQQPGWWKRRRHLGKQLLVKMPDNSFKICVYFGSDLNVHGAGNK